MLPEVITSLLTTITNTLGRDGIIKIAGMVGFINAFLSLAITQSFSRKAFIRWRPYLLGSLFLLWIVVVFVLIDVYIQTIRSTWLFYLSTFGVILWIIGVIILLWTFWNIFTIDRHRFSITGFTDKGKKFEYFDTHFWKDVQHPTCIDVEIARVNWKKPSDSTSPKPTYPLVLVADESWKPWDIAGDFAVNALADNAGVIWFFFVRPARPYDKSKLKERIESRGIKTKDIKNRIIQIDCFDPGQNLKKTYADTSMDNVLYADPRNPDEIDRQYSKAVKILKNELGCKRLCVIYDTISDFLYFSDVEMASRYLRVVMAWEEMNNVHSLYILRLGVLDQKLEQYILWYANTVITLKTENDKPMMMIRGLENEPKSYKIDYLLNFRS